MRAPVRTGNTTRIKHEPLKRVGEERGQWQIHPPDTREPMR